MDKYACIAVCFLLVLSGVTELICLAQGDISDGLAVHYTFDDEAAGVMTDSSGEGNNGVISGGTYAAGKIGSGLSLDGTNDYGYIPVSAQLQDLPQFTVATWIHLDTLASYNTVFDCNWWNDSSNARTWLYVSDDEDKTRFIASDSDGGQSYRDSNAYSSLVEGWHHLTGVFQTGVGVKFYIDSALVTDAVSGTNTGLFTQEKAAGVGAIYYAGPAGYFDGVLDDFRIYTRALTAGEVAALYDYTGETGTVTEQDLNWMAFIVLMAFAFLNVVLMLMPRIYVLNFVVGALTLAFSAATVNDSTLPIQPYFSLIVALLAVLGILRAANLLRNG